MRCLTVVTAAAAAAGVQSVTGNIEHVAAVRLTSGDLGVRCRCAVGGGGVMGRARCQTSTYDSRPAPPRCNAKHRHDARQFAAAECIIVTRTERVFAFGHARHSGIFFITNHSLPHSTRTRR